MKKKFTFTYDCINCAIGSLVTLFKKGIVPDELRDDSMLALLLYLSTTDYRQSPPRLGQQMHRIIRDILNNPELYREIKKESNAVLMDCYPVFKRKVLTDPDPLKLALMMSRHRMQLTWESIKLLLSYPMEMMLPEFFWIIHQRNSEKYSKNRT